MIQGRAILRRVFSEKIWTDWGVCAIELSGMLKTFNMLSFKTFNASLWCLNSSQTSADFAESKSYVSNGGSELCNYHRL